MKTTLSPSVDLAFKKIFASEENKDLLISLINSIVSEEDQVADITLLNPYNLQNYEKDKLSILDIKAKGLDGRHFNIEMQVNDTGDYEKRALYYWSKLYTEQLGLGSPYRDLCKVIGIHILHAFSISENQDYHSVFQILEKTKGFRCFENFELHTIELKKFQGSETKEQTELVSKIKTALDTWMGFLTRHALWDRKNLPDTIPQKAQLDKALGVLESINLNEKEREIYDAEIKQLRDGEGIIYTAMQKGREEGGKEQTLRIAKNLLENGMDDQKISSITGLTLTEIKTLK